MNLLMALRATCVYPSACAHTRGRLVCQRDGESFSLLAAACGGVWTRLCGVVCGPYVCDDAARLLALQQRQEGLKVRERIDLRDGSAGRDLAQAVVQRLEVLQQPDAGRPAQPQRGDDVVDLALRGASTRGQPARHAYGSGRRHGSGRAGPRTQRVRARPR